MTDKSMFLVSPNARRIAIIDIDGTIADLSHRLHHVRGKHRDYDKFFSLVEEDKPIQKIIDLVRVLDDVSGEYYAILVSGRTEDCREATQRWLQCHNVFYRELYMRPSGDTRPDYVVKKEILDKIKKDFPAPGWEISFAIDDRPSVVKMWRENGITCLQCAEWNEGESTFGGSLAFPHCVLTLMIGPSGAGKSYWLQKMGWNYGIHSEHVVSTDILRRDASAKGDFKDQSNNDRVFSAARALCKVRLEHGLNVCIDATNLNRKDRMQYVDIAARVKCRVRYIIIDRPMFEKARDGGWRNDPTVGDLMIRHENKFKSSMKHILEGDNIEINGVRIEVIDLRSKYEREQDY